MKMLQTHAAVSMVHEDSGTSSYNVGKTANVCVCTRSVCDSAMLGSLSSVCYPW